MKLNRVPKIIPISKRRPMQNEVLSALSEDPVVLTQHGEAVAVLVDPNQWNQLIDELEEWQDSFEAMEARYQITVGKEEIVEFKSSQSGQ